MAKHAEERLGSGVKVKRRIYPSQSVLNIILIFLLFIMLYPLALTVWGSFKSDLGFQYTKWYPTLPLWGTNYSTAGPQMITYMINTTIVAGVGTLGMLFLASLGAYGFARVKFVGREAIYMAVIALMMIPGVLSLVPSFMLWKSILGLNNYWILILPIWFGGTVFGVFLLRAFFTGIPEEIFESARIDGANEFKVYFNICLPMSMPILGTLTIMQITSTWNDYLWPLICIQEEKYMTITVGLMVRFTSQYANNYPVMFAAYVIASIPLILLFIFANRFYIEGLTASAIKI